MVRVGVTTATPLAQITPGKVFHRWLCQTYRQHLLFLSKHIPNDNKEKSNCSLVYQRGADHSAKLSLSTRNLSDVHTCWPECLYFLFLLLHSPQFSKRCQFNFLSFLSLFLLCRSSSSVSSLSPHFSSSDSQTPVSPSIAASRPLPPAAAIPSSLRLPPQSELRTRRQRQRERERREWWSELGFEQADLVRLSL